MVGVLGGCHVQQVVACHFQIFVVGFCVGYVVVCMGLMIKACKELGSYDNPIEGNAAI